MNAYTVTVESWEGARFVGRGSDGRPCFEYDDPTQQRQTVVGYCEARRIAKALRQHVRDSYRFGVVSVSGPLPSQEVRATYHANPRPSEQPDRFEVAETREQRREAIASMFRRSLNRRPVAEVSR